MLCCAVLLCASIKCSDTVRVCACVWFDAPLALLETRGFACAINCGYNMLQYEWRLMKGFSITVSRFTSASIPFVLLLTMTITIAAMPVLFHPCA